MNVGTSRQSAQHTGRSKLGTALRARWRRLPVAGSDPGGDPAAAPATDEEIRAARLRRLGAVCAVLEGAHRTVEGGWVQGRWFARTESVEVPALGATGVRAAPDAPVGACVVGAVVHAARHEEQHIGAAVDFLWDAWHQVRGVDGVGVGGRAAPPAVRTARVRDLTAWNDEPGRTRDDVLHLIDVATTRTIMEAMAAR